VELVSFACSLNEKEQRGIAENLSEEEVVIFDLLIRPNIKLNKKEREQVKQVAKELLDTLKAERIVLDWRPAPPSVWRFSTPWNNSLRHIPKIYMTRNANWSINMFMRLM
jgi:type I restriction enzyme R subunit